MNTIISPVPGQRHIVHLSTCVALTFRYIPAGEFRMGNRGYKNYEEPVHRVRVAHPFWLGETPVTQAQYAVWSPAEGAKHKNYSPDHPAQRISWRRAVRYCGWLSRTKAGELPAEFRLACLPTEAEWEYACRAGSETEYYSGDGDGALSEVGWHAGNSGGEPHAVDELTERHRWGLRGMHGNGWEWCHDIWDERAYRRRLDGESDSASMARTADYASRWEELLEDVQPRVFRGGAWNFHATYCRSAYRIWRLPAVDFGILGFRVCLASSTAVATKADRTEEPEAKLGAGD